MKDSTRKINAKRYFWVIHHTDKDDIKFAVTKRFINDISMIQYVLRNYFDQETINFLAKRAHNKQPERLVTKYLTAITKGTGLDYDSYCQECMDIALVYEAKTK